MAELIEIEKLTRGYSDARSSLAATLSDLDQRIEALKRQFLPGIKVQVGIAKERQSLLLAAIEASKALFIKPRTIILHGIKVGFGKGKGKLIIDDQEATIRLIKKHFPEQAEALIKTKETPRKSGLETLSVAELKSVGVKVEDTGDRIIIAPVDSQVEKLVDKLLEEKGSDTGEDDE
jgi:hypothetical protein